MILLISLPCFILAILVRILPSLIKKESGVDHWFWKAYIETCKRNRQFPPVLPQYLLDQHQWYPPLFPLFISCLPGLIFDQYSHLLAIIIDIIRMILLMETANWLSGGDIYVIFFTGLVYATTPILVSYNVQLNPRGLGALFLDGLIVLLLWIYLLHGPQWIWGFVLLLSSLLLLTHKMTTQIFWFLCLGTGLLMLDWRLFALIPASFLVAWVLSRGFYLNVLRAHWDIVTFWFRNWPWLQAHPIKESPIYGNEGFETQTKFHRKGFRGILRHISYLAGFNPWVWLLLITIIADGKRYFLGGLSPILCISWWMMLIIIFVLLTVFIPIFKCLGSGYLYLYNVSFPAALMWGFVMRNEIGHLWLIYMLALVGASLSLTFFYRRISLIKSSDDEFEQVIYYLKNAPKGPIMCLPPLWYDVVAYKTGQPVVFGGHGYGFKLLEPLFPRIKISVKMIIKEYKVKYLVTSDGYLPETFLNEISSNPAIAFGKYRLYLLGGSYD